MSSKMETLFWATLLLCSALQVRAGFFYVRTESSSESYVVRKLDVPGVTEGNVNVTCAVGNVFTVDDVTTLLHSKPTCLCSGMSEQLIVLSTESTTGPEQPVANPLRCPFPGACSFEVKRIQSFKANSTTGDASFTVPKAVGKLVGGWSWAKETSSKLESSYSCSVNQRPAHGTGIKLTLTVEPMFIKVTLLERIRDEPTGGGPGEGPNCRFVQYFLPQTSADGSIKGILQCSIQPF